MSNAEQLKVRRATKDDLEILLAFEQGVVSAERPYDPTIKPDPVLYYDLEQMLSDEEVAIMVVTFNEQIVGSGYAHIREARSYLDHQKYAYLGFMYTDEAHRGKGINKMIIDALKAWTITQGINEIRLTVYSDNLPAIRAYEKVGFQSHMIEMRMDRDLL